MEEENLQDLAAAFNNREITDDEGQLLEEPTSTEYPADLETQTPDDYSDTGENPVDDSDESTQDYDDEDDANHSEENSDQRIPKKRFDDVYGKLKKTERELEDLRTRSTQQPEPQGNVSREDQLEIDMLKIKHPEFDRESDQYDPALDQLGLEIWEAHDRNITRSQAAKLAKDRKASLVRSEVERQTKTRNRQLKQQQSEPSITRRVPRTQEPDIDIDNASDEELEQYMKKEGIW